MKSRPRASTLEELEKIIQEAIYESGDMLAAMEYDEEGMPGAIDFAHILDHQLKALLNDVQSGEHEFKDEDLPFVSVLQGRMSFMVPFHDLLHVINETHRKGLLTEDE